MKKGPGHDARAPLVLPRAFDNRYFSTVILWTDVSPPWLMRAK
jgi:hypothetical protein